MNQKNTFLFLGIIPAALLQSIGAFVYFILLNGSPFAQTAYLIDKIVIISLLIFWIIRRPPLPKFVISKSLIDILLGIFVGILMISIISIIAWINWDELIITAPAISQKISSFSLLTKYFIGTAIIFSLFHSLFEEWYWRWFVVKGLELHLSSTKAFVIGGLAFTAHHVVILSQFFSWPITIFFSSGIFLAGIIWSTLYSKTGNLTASWISHAMVDLIIFAIISKLI